MVWAVKLSWRRPSQTPRVRVRWIKTYIPSSSYLILLPKFTNVSYIMYSWKFVNPLEFVFLYLCLCETGCHGWTIVSSPYLCMYVHSTVSIMQIWCDIGWETNLADTLVQTDLRKFVHILTHNKSIHKKYNKYVISAHSSIYYWALLNFFFLDCLSQSKDEFHNGEKHRMFWFVTLFMI